MKTTTSVTVDAILLQKAKVLKINVSGLVNDVLKSIICTDDEIDIFEIEKSLDNLNDDMMKLKTKQNELLAKKIAFSEKKKKFDSNNLKEALKEAQFIKNSGVLEEDDL